MRKHLVMLLLAGALLLVPACSNTVEGLEEDTNQNVDEVQEELDEEDDEG